MSVEWANRPTERIALSWIERREGSQIDSELDDVFDEGLELVEMSEEDRLSLFLRSVNQGEDDCKAIKKKITMHEQGIRLIKEDRLRGNFFTILDGLSIVQGVLGIDSHLSGEWSDYKIGIMRERIKTVAEFALKHDIDLWLGIDG